MLPIKMAADEPIDDTGFRLLSETAFEYFNCVVSTQQLAMLENFDRIRKVWQQLSPATPERSLDALQRAWLAADGLRQSSNPLCDGQRSVATKLPDDVPTSVNLTNSTGPFVTLEKICAASLGDGMKLFELLQQSLSEFDFGTLFKNPFTREAETLGPRSRKAVCAVPRQTAGLVARQSGDAELQFVETLIQMLLLVCREGPDGTAQFESISGLFATTEPFSKIEAELLDGLIDRQVFIVDREPDRALTSLSDRLTSQFDRRRAFDIVRDLAGSSLGNGDAAARVWRQFSALVATKPQSTVEITTQPCTHRSTTLSGAAE